MRWEDGNIQGASLDHAMWFHRTFRADEWLLYDQISPSASGARGFAEGRIYTHDGRLAVSVVQEGLDPRDLLFLLGLLVRALLALVVGVQGRAHAESLAKPSDTARASGSAIGARRTMPSASAKPATRSTT